MYYLLGNVCGRIAAGVKRFFKEEKGASDMVAVIVLIVIVVAVAIIFKDTITSAANSVMDKLNTFIDS